MNGLILCAGWQSVVWISANVIRGAMDKPTKIPDPACKAAEYLDQSRLVVIDQSMQPAQRIARLAAANQFALRRFR